MVPKTNDEIYVSITIGIYNYFLSEFCAKEGIAVGDIESEVAT